VGAADADEHVAEAGNATEQGTDLDYLDPLQRVYDGGLHWRKVGPRVGERFLETEFLRKSGGLVSALRARPVGVVTDGS
jgi:hypothetical protein